MQTFPLLGSGRCLLLAIALLTTSAALAQSPAPAAPAAVANTGSLTGTVLDSVSRQPVSYATVVLLPTAGSEKAISGVAADDAGKFSLTKLPTGTFRLRISYVGYGTHTQAVTVTSGATALGTIRLPAAATALNEAVVVGAKPVVEVRPDRLVYNAEQDLSNAGGTATDVLRKSPLLAVDGEGNVKMRGSSNFRVLVNNKPSPTLASNLTEALKSIPADQIKSVEIITTPPAKYDGEGTAGIINIILKKGVDQGVNGRIGASGGNRNSNFNSALNFKKGKVGFTSSASAGAWYNPGYSERTRVGYNEERQEISNLLQTADVYNKGKWYYGTLGLDYDPAEHHSISLAGSINGYGGNSTNDLFNRLTGLTNRLYTRRTDNRFSGLNVEGTGTYTRTFKQARKEWSVLGQYALNTGTFGYDFDQYDNSTVLLPAEQATYRERSRGRTPGHEITLQSDFTQPFGDKNTLEMGVKAIFRRTGSVANVDTLRPADNPSYLPDGRRITDFSYAQDVQAAYATYSFGLGKKTSLSLGSRLERTALSADFRTSASFTPPAYLSLLPNGSAQYKLSEASSVRAAYSRRITRPFIDYLNPFVDRSDRQNLSFGNPYLSPELTDAYELSYNTNFKSNSINISASVRHTGNAIESVRFLTTNPSAPLPAGVVPDPSVTAQTFQNVAANTFYQLNFYGSFKPLENWDLSGGPDVQYIVRRSPALNTNRQGLTAGLNLNTSYKLKKGFSLQGFVYASLPSPDIQGRGSANLYYQMGAKKTFLKEKADLVLNFGSPFNNYWPYRNTVSTALFEERSEFRAYQRSFRLSFSYRFGQAQQGKQRKQISNDDTKGGGSKQGG
ncbi:TonB-dependent receptor domain-containing protein [Hymenobacter setariae]|uniref:TonB-dependent receptor domain-containing protein n=1 Tax=Hymenobacter setariae TaxID=2594794 RepID=UPI001F2A93E3|nr:TonB-dependent receptor [Hymenobacter setariae]